MSPLLHSRLLLDQTAGLAEKIAGLDAELRKRVTADATAKRLTTIPGVGAVTAAAITTFAPPMETFLKEPRRWGNATFGGY
jgi:transposase